jgi:Protein of unknown function (DUF2510)
VRPATSQHTQLGMTGRLGADRRAESKLAASVDVWTPCSSSPVSPRPLAASSSAGRPALAGWTQSRHFPSWVGLPVENWIKRGPREGSQRSRAWGSRGDMDAADQDAPEPAPPPGWYPPRASDARRYWNGCAWTGHVAPPGTPTRPLRLESERRGIFSPYFRYPWPQSWFLGANRVADLTPEPRHRGRLARLIDAGRSHRPRTTQGQDDR